MRRAVPAPPVEVPAPPPAEIVLDPSGVAIEYRGSAPLILRGAETGRLYAFSLGRRFRSVDRADASSLLRNSLFRRADRDVRRA